jgi:hypothetical protein
MMSGRLLILALVCTVAWIVVSIAICIWAMVIGEYKMRNYEHPIAEVAAAIWSRLMSAILTLVLVAGCLYLFGL